MKKQVLETADGSTSIYLEELDEHYHSKHGAVAESQHIFVKNGLLAKSNLQKIKVFEIGMGTGLNVLTTFVASEEHDLNVEMHTVEAYPVDSKELTQMNFAEILNVEKAIFDRIHLAEWSREHSLSTNFKLIKYHDTIQNIEFTSNMKSNGVDVIYFDAFAPEKQEEMWNKEVFEKLYGVLNESGILVTYCVKGVIRRRLAEVGFKVEKLAGPKGGKREMCRAIKINS